MRWYVLDFTGVAWVDVRGRFEVVVSLDDKVLGKLYKDFHRDNHWELDGNLVEFFGTNLFGFSRNINAVKVELSRLARGMEVVK